MSHAQIPEDFLSAWPTEITFSTGRGSQTNRYARQRLPAEEFIAHITNHRDGEKEGSAWSPFPYKDDIRRTENCIGADVLVLDIDDGTPWSEGRAKLFVCSYAAVVATSYSNLSTKTDFPRKEYDSWREKYPRDDEEDFMRTRDKGYRRAVWRGSKIVRGRDGEPSVKQAQEDGKIVEKITIEHAPCPKFRITAPLAKPFRVANYSSPAEAADAWRRISWEFASELGLKTDPKALLLTQLFFDPRHPPGVMPVVRFVSGRALDIAVRTGIAGHIGGQKRHGHGEPRPVASAPRQSSSANMFKGDIEVLRSAVMAIPHDEQIDMDAWVAIIGAIHDEADGSDAGNELAHEWSATWVKGYDQAETEGVWRRAVSNGGRNTNKATGATIRLRAVNAGWEPPKGWTWPDGRNSNIVFTDERDQQENVDRFNETFAVIKNRGTVRILSEDKDANGLDMFDLLVERDFNLLTRNFGVVTTMDANGKPKSVPAAIHWLNSPQRREYRALVFCPGEALASEPRSNGHAKFYNLWRGWGVSSSRGGSCRLFKQHLLENVCGGDVTIFNWIMDWMAHIFQRAGEKPGVAIVLRGKQGTGKSIVGKSLGVLIGGRHYFVVSQKEQLVGKFNAHLASALLVQAEEAFFVHDPNAWGALKDLITRETRTVEPKGVDAFMVPAFDRLIITSNEAAVVPAEAGVRRYAVFDVSDACARNTEYFAAIEDELKADGNSGYAQLHYELSQRDLSDFDCRTAPPTRALAEQKRHNLKPIAQWMLDRLTDGAFWTVRDNEERHVFEDARAEGNSSDVDTQRSVTIGKDTLRRDYLDYCRNVHHKSYMSEAELGKWLVENVGFQPCRRRCKADRRDNARNVVKRKGDIETCYRLPLLVEARERFIKSFELPLTTFDEPHSDSI